MTRRTPDPDSAAPRPLRRPRLDLPFDGRREDAGTWAYDHRIGLCITLIAYLVLMIVLVSSKIVVGRRPSAQGIYIDLHSLAELERERNRLEEEVRRRQEQQEPIDWRSIRNAASNENALNEELKDDRGTNAAAINEAAAEAADRMRANREAYEQGLAEEAAIRQRTGSEEGAERQDRKLKGRVTVSFSLVDPVRTSRKLVVPAYRCEGGGDVEVEIAVDRTGEVTAARVISGGDACMRETALRAARASRFNIDRTAPARQQGTITYIFIPQ
ncbi:MAG: energy transducer TonB [Alistipes sp.]|nr:energy transducer TonB [Alistipes senegalensis]MCM1250048.1 energy transducer TonB [Alistipes sp.]